MVHAGCLTKPNGGHLGVRVSSGHTHHTEGGSYIGRGTVTWDETLFSCHLLCCSIHNMSPPDIGPRKIIGPSVRKRWDENTPSSKGPHIVDLALGRVQVDQDETRDVVHVSCTRRYSSGSSNTRPICGAPGLILRQYSRYCGFPERRRWPMIRHRPQVYIYSTPTSTPLVAECLISR